MSNGKLCRLVAVSDIKWMICCVASYANGRKAMRSKASCVCGGVGGAMVGLTGLLLKLMLIVEASDCESDLVVG